MLDTKGLLAPGLASMASRAAIDARTSQYPGRLIRLPASEQNPDRFSLNIIFIPEARISASDQDNSPKWPSKLVQGVAPGAQLLWFDYYIDPHSEAPIWHLLGEQGENLRFAIENSTQTYHLDRRRLVYICHGLGGLVLKKALVGLHESLSNSALRPVLEAESGIVFLGTPHIEYEEKDSWEQLAIPLQSIPNISKQIVSRAVAEAAIAAGLSSRFTQAGIEVPILSIYERSKNGFARRLSMRKKRPITAELAQTLLTNETLVGVDMEHTEVTSLGRDTEAYGKLRDLLEKAIAMPLVSTVTISNSLPRRPLERTISNWSSEASDLPRTKPKPSLNPGDGPTSAELGVPNLITSISMVKTRRTVRMFDSGPLLNPVPMASALSSLDEEEGIFEMEPLETIVSRPEPKLPCRMSPPDMADHFFKGRTDILAAIDEALLPSRLARSTRAGTRCFALCGMGGMGKTQIAGRYAKTRKKKFDAVFWVEADGKIHLAASFGNIAVHLGLTSIANLDHTVSRNVVLEWLNNPIKPASQDSIDESVPVPELASWLLVFNNVDQPEFIHDYLPADTANGSIIITTRVPLQLVQDDFAKTGIDPSNVIGLDINGFTVTEAVDLLQEATGFDPKPENMDAARAIAVRLSGFPLALRQVIPLINSSSVRMVSRAFGERLPEVIRNVDPTDEIEDNPTYPHTILTVWALESLSPDAHWLLTALCYMSPDRILDEVLAPGYCEAVFQVAPRFPQNKRQHIDARDELVRSSIIRYDATTNIITVHRLVQDVVRSRLTPAEAVTAFEVVSHLMHHSWPWSQAPYDHDYVFKYWEDYSNLLPHIRRLASVFKRNPQWKLSDRAMLDFLRLLQAAAWQLMEGCNYEAATGLLELCLTTCRLHSPNTRQILSEALFCQTKMGFRTQMDPQKILEYAQEHVHHRERLEQQESTPLARIGLGNSHGEVGMAYFMMGEYEKAIDNCNSCILLLTMDDTDDLTFPNFANMFSALAHHALGRDDEALKRLDRVIQHRIHKFGEETKSYKLACVLQAKAIILERQSKLEDAYHLYRRAFDLYKNGVGPNYWGAAQCCVKLGDRFLRKKQLVTARTYYIQALKALQVYKYYARELCRVKFKLGSVYEAQGDARGKQYLDEAEEEYWALEGKGEKRVLGEADYDALVGFLCR
ncbi:hypothetical protein KVT40_002889 [Elsinoe batatas]|uniref:DUF7779 domain-containing protein n=1 Tax=Elsinoe batatas TaxID=2601811 RepID=A0A8K0PKN0_9PEZI|nr:hypothetical protein KVT40_002889 [Elsinoe batatas]